VSVLDRVFDGIWWVPNRPENRFGGRLTSSFRDGMRLEILGELMTDWELAGPIEVPVIHGAIRQGSSSYITLFDSFHLTRTSRGEFAQQTYAPRVASIGVYYERLDDLSFDSCDVRFSHLDEWLDRGGFTVTFDEDQGSDAFSISHRRPTFATVSLPGLDVGFSARCETGPFGGRSFHLDETTSMKLSFTERCSLEDLRNAWLWRIQNFFTLAAGASCRIEKLIASHDGQAVELLFRHPFDADPISRFDLVFRCSDVEQRLAELLTRWFDLYDRLHVPLNVLFSTIHRRSQLVDEQFLAACQAAEAYHRLSTRPDEAEEQRNDARVAEVVEACPQEHRDWLKARLQYSSEPTLRTRIEAVLGRTGDLLGEVLFQRKYERAARDISRWRNDLTHGRAPRVNTAKDAQSVYELTSRLVAALKVNLLLDLGFALDEVQDLYQRCGWERLVRL